MNEMGRTTGPGPGPSAHDGQPPGPVHREQPIKAEGHAPVRDVLADNRTLLAWIRTALAFAGLGFVVAKFGRTPDLIRVAGYLGIFLTLVGLLIAISGYAQYRATLGREEPPPGAPALSRWAPVMAAATCALACALLAAYLAVST